VLTFLRILPWKLIRWAILRRFMFIQAIILLVRSISINLTILTLPLPDCKSTATGSPYYEAIRIFFMQSRTCADILFSGHTASITLLALIWTTYSKGEEWQLCLGEDACYYYPLGRPKLSAVGDPNTIHWTVIIVWMVACTGYFLIISTWFHYSCDVFIGFWLAQLFWGLYHYFVKAVLEQVNWMARFFIWFEGIKQLVPEYDPEKGLIGYSVSWTAGIREQPIATLQQQAQLAIPPYQIGHDLEKQERVLVAGEIVGPIEIDSDEEEQAINRRRTARYH
jgi:hypothetical protein